MAKAESGWFHHFGTEKLFAKFNRDLCSIGSDRESGD